ncbi:RNA polymerase sigma factor [Polyangium spumosum]|uniref:RNA polymerase sigma factor n=1 Tax=Polyangium spumosum TaxID=889282 RepID=UPI00129B908A|nr:sigma-70 family RNA polymerase sigma factor [Polyangium spumosum]
MKESTIRTKKSTGLSLPSPPLWTCRSVTSLAHVYTGSPSSSPPRLAALAALRPVIFAWTGRWVSSLADRDDITQDVLCRAATSRTGADIPDDELRPWLFVITMRMACKYRRDKQRCASAGEVSPDEIVSPNVSPEVEVERAEFLRFLRDELAKLTPRQRAVFIGYEIEEKTFETIARSLGISTASAKNAAFQARMRLYVALCERERDRRGILPLLLFFLSGRWWRGSPGGESPEGASAPPGRRRSRRWADMLGPLWPPLVGVLVGGAAVAAWLLPSEDAPRVRHLHLAPYVLVIFDHVQERVASIEPPPPVVAPSAAPASSPRATGVPKIPPTTRRKLDVVLRQNTHDPKDD